MNEELLYDDIVETQVATQQEGLMDSVKEYLDPRKWPEKCNLTKQRMIEMGIYFAIGFAFGYLAKKYANFLYAAAITIACMVALHYVGFINIAVNMNKIQSMFGITMPPFQSGVLAQYWEWIKVNVALVVSLAIGFVVGIKVA